MLGMRLAHYHVETELGAGGMGVVYRATDTRLGRPVAIKMLHESCQRDPERLGRFEREARVLPSLNHTNIAAIHGLECAGAVSFLVLEFVPGVTLAQRLDRGPLPVKEALTIARQVAEALEVAHARGVIHRDLKPANIKLTPEGQVKVLDFGLAKAFEAAPAVEAGMTMTAAADLTQAGIVMGTVAYMSPEQASGRPVDQRTDLWAFGCVLYELLTGTRTFAGASTTEVLVGVLDREPDWNALPAGTPENIKQLLRRCLAKDVRCRLHHAADARLELEDTLAGRVSGPVAALPARMRVGRLLATAAAGLLLGAAAAGVWLGTATGAPEEPRVVQFTVDLPEGQRIVPSWRSADIAFSPDAKALFYGASFPPPTTVYARRLDESTGGLLDLAKGLVQPIPSPDGRWLALADYSKGALVKVPLSGGAPVPLGDLEMAFGGAWAPDGSLYWSKSLIAGIVRTPAEGGETEPMTTLEAEAGERNHRYAALLADRGVMFTVATHETDSYDDASIDVYEFATGKRKTLVRGGTYARYSPSGHIVYARGGSLYAAAVDPERLEVVGPPVKVLDGVLMSTNIGRAFYDISAAGDLAYAVGPPEDGRRTLHWVDRQGRESPALPLPARSYLNPRISPDGTSLAIEIEGANHDLYVFDFHREVLSRVSYDGRSHGPIWSPDAKHLAFRTWSAGKMTLAWMPSDRSRESERLVDYTAWQSAASFSPDGKYLAFDQTDSGVSGVWMLPVSGDRKPQPFIRSGGAAKFSPDGRWIVYCSEESGRPEIYVQAWPGPWLKVQISSDGGLDPVWSRDGREIFYRSGSKMIAVAVTTTPTFKAEKPQVLWTGEYTLGLSSSCGLRGVTFTSYDVSADGQRFLMIKDNDRQFYATQIKVVINWVQELKRLMEQAAGARPT